MCAAPHADDAYYCDFIAARGLDGLAFGVQFKVDIDAYDYYCAGFHRAESFDHFVCAENNSFIENYYFPQNYTVTADFIAGTGIDYYETTSWGYYGFSEFLFQYSYYNYLETADWYYNFAFRFIGANENDGLRYNVGDTIDMFFVDFMNDEHEENADFELLGATTLAAGGAALLMAVLM
jgi:hypothetical protein